MYRSPVGLSGVGLATGLPRHSPEAAPVGHEFDQGIGPYIDHLLAAGVVVLSEYGLAPAHRPIDINRALRHAGLLEVYVQGRMEYLNPWTSRAFAFADHRVAHIYVRDPADRAGVAGTIAALDGVAEILDSEDTAVYGMDRGTSGDLVALAEPDAWFTYYYWLDDADAPDFAQHVHGHRMPGHSPTGPLHDRAVPATRLRTEARTDHWTAVGPHPLAARP
ncbi:alkaline phosphatase family protein [Streptomyces spongiae]|uniref:Alkaline phosphatase family protein n=1 Tax=Streptomyces spongiae TaxID=565072 RepID=A0A5N8X8V5_9ACTN|nr:alkaline phosphatase family protein [Streptomyces spongiae]MPY55931.1 alkaline phosphatase family protein [Streptomyces spongiae]